MFKVLTLVYLLMISTHTFAQSNKSNQTFKQLKQDMLVHGLDFKYITSSMKSPLTQLQNYSNEIESLRPEPGVYPEEINVILETL